MKEITLTVIIEGTIYSIEEPNTHLHQILYHDCAGERIRSLEQLKEQLTSSPDTSHLKMGFNGCAVDYGLGGLVWGTGVEAQSQQIEAVTKELIKAGYKVKLNIIGLSRGGITGIRAAQQLGHIDPFHLETNLLLLDPVPGNLLLTSKLDFFNWTLANQTKDLSQSKNLKYVETLYPYLEVGDDTGNATDQLLSHLHVPLRPTYPQHCEVREEVILGAHLRAFQDLEKNNEEQLRYGLDIIPIIKKLSQTIIYQFLTKVGSFASSLSSQEIPEIATAFEREKEKWTAKLEEIIANIIPQNRSLHSLDNSQITVANHAPFLNLTHRELADKTDNSGELCLKVVPERAHSVITKAPLTEVVLLGLIQTIERGMTVESRQGKKGLLLKKISTGLEDGSALTEEQLSFVLRDIIAITLQRDRYSFSFYKTTTSGLTLVTALNNPEFESVRQRLRLDEQPISYDDLTSYALGREDLTHFNSQLKAENLDEIEAHELGDDGYSLLLR